MSYRLTADSHVMDAICHSQIFLEALFPYIYTPLIQYMIIFLQIDIAGAHNNIGILYQSQKQLDKAESHYTQAIEILVPVRIVRVRGSLRQAF